MSALIALLLGAAPAAQTTQPTAFAAGTTTNATVARVRVAVSTTSSQVAVRFDQGEILGQRILSLKGGATVEPATGGWIVKGQDGRSTSAELLAVYRERTNAPNITIEAARGMSGTGTVTVTNESASAFRVAQLNVGTQPQASTTLSRAAVFGRSDPAMPRADARRLVLAFYYPWWTREAYDRQQLSDRPAVPRNARSSAQDILSMTRQAKAAGIDGFIVSWAGGGQGINARGFDLALRAAEQTGSVATISLPVQNIANGAVPDRAVAKQWIEEALERSSSKAFLRKDGVPAIFVYQMRLLSPEDWRWILDGLSREGRPVRLIGDAVGLQYAGVNWGIYQYVPNRYDQEELLEWNVTHALNLKLLRANSADRAFLATVSPGFNAVRRADDPIVVDRGPNGERYAATWESAIASRPDWIIVTSWNEWFEGTSVEPSVSFGDRALKQTKTFAAQFKG